jgi:hypothetical protein
MFRVTTSLESRNIPHETNRPQKFVDTIEMNILAYCAAKGDDAWIEFSSPTCGMDTCACLYVLYL